MQSFQIAKKYHDNKQMNIKVSNKDVSANDFVTTNNENSKLSLANLRLIKRTSLESNKLRL